MIEPGDALPSGYTVAGYTLVRVLGAGGFSITYEALNAVTERRVAIKEFFPSGLARRDARSQVIYSQARTELITWALEKFRSTTTALCRLHHPNIVQVYDFLPANGTGYMIMELLEGATFEDWLLSLGSHRPSAAELRPLLEPVLDALAYVHSRGLIHRDIAPDNIVITESGRPVLIDFGALSQDVTQATRAAGTVGIAKTYYTAPEQATAKASPNPTTDIYSMGAVIYRAVTGRPPEDGTQRVAEMGLGGGDPYVPLVRRADVEPILAWAVDSALRLRKAERPQSVQGFASMLGWSLPSAPALPAAAPFATTIEAPEPGAASRADHEPADLAPPAPDPDAGPLTSAPDRNGLLTRRRAVLAAGVGLPLLAALGLIYARSPADRPGTRAARSGDPSASRSEDTPKPSHGLEPIVTFHDEIAPGAAFSASGRYAVTGGTDQAPKLWDLGSGRLIRALPKLPASANSVALLEDRFVAAAASGSAIATVWDASGAEIGVLQGGDRGQVRMLEFLPDGRRIAVASARGIAIYDVRSSRPVLELEDSGDPQRFALSPARNELIAGLRGGRLIRRYDLGSGRGAGETTLAPGNEISALDISRDGQWLALGTVRGGLALHRAADLAEVRRFDGHDKRINAVGFSPDGALIVSAGWDGALRVWSAGTGQERAQVMLSAVATHNRAAFTAPTTVAAASLSGLFRWRPELR